MVVSNSREYPVSGPKAVIGNSIQESKAIGERALDVASGFANLRKFPIGLFIWFFATAEQLSVVGVGLPQEDVREFRKFFQ